MTVLNDTYDVVVVGAGIGGLTCGALLAKNKKSVLIVEQSATAGGYCSSFEHRGYVFDTGLTSLTGCELGGAIYSVLDDLELRDSIEFMRVKPSVRIVGGDYDFRISSAEGLEDKLRKLFSMETLHIRQFVGECKTVASEMEELSGRSPDLMNMWQRLAFRMALFLRYRRAMIYGRKSWKQVIEGFFEDPKLRAITLSMLPYFDSGAAARLPMTELGTQQDFYYPRGGAQALADVLADGLQRYDGHLSLGSAVDRIMVENGRAVGVQLGDERQIKARCVVSNVDARQTFLKLVGEEHLGSRFVRKLGQGRLSGSAFVVSLGVKLNLKAMGFDGTCIICNPSDDADELLGSDPEKCTVTINLHSILDPSQAWGSTTAVQLTAMLPYDMVEDWGAEEGAIADKLTATAEKVIPKLSDQVVSRHILSPLTLEQSTANNEGAVRGWYPAPRSGARSQKTPIKSLYQAGHWTFRGGGVPAVVASGKNAARLVLKEK